MPNGETLEEVPSKLGTTSKGISLFTTALKFLANAIGKLETVSAPPCTRPRHTVHTSVWTVLLESCDPACVSVHGRPANKNIMCGKERKHYHCIEIMQFSLRKCKNRKPIKINQMIQLGDMV